VPEIAETHRVCRHNLLGCGLSDQPPDGYRYTPETIGAQILTVLDALSLPRVHWMGESSGGIIGLLLAAAHPDLIASLVFSNTPTRIPDHVKRTYAVDRATASTLVSVNGAGRPSATGSIWSMRARICATGSCARWIGHRRTSLTRCMIVSRALIPCRCCRG
jgi:pimeloyl-ACP methyl ester carboxylesterase